MWFSIGILVLLLAIAFFQSTQGLFSALIMAVLTIACAAFAYGAYEWVAVTFLAKYWQPDLAHPIALAVLFGVPLVILRVIFDKVIRRACLLPSLIDRIGGAVCGLVTALIMVGVAVTAVQMLPFGTSILGFSRFDLALREGAGGSVTTPPALDAPQRGFWLSPDRFAAGAVALLSDGVFSGQRSFYREHPDLLQAVAWDDTINSAVSRYAPPGSISVKGSEPVEVVYRMIPSERDNGPAQYEPINPRGGYEFRMVSVKLTPAAFDANRTHLFSLRQFRLVGEEDDSTKQYFPIARQQADASQTVNRYVSVKRSGSQDWPVVDELITPREDHAGEVELVFEVPKGFKPDFIEYKRAARAKVSFAPAAAPPPQTRQETKAVTPPSPPPAPLQESRTASRRSARPENPEPSRRKPRRNQTAAPEPHKGGNVRNFTTISGKSFFGDQLPFELTRYQGLQNAEVTKAALVSGHLVAVADEQEGGTDQPVSMLQVPEDKRLLQLNVGKLHARSGLGGALSHAISVVQNYTVMDAAGNVYKVIGKYALADVHGQKVFEVVYFPNPVGTVGGLGKFDRIDEKQLSKSDDIVFLFLVNPGAEIVSFSTGGSATRADDLKAENLKAPE